MSRLLAEHSLISTEAIHWSQILLEIIKLLYNDDERNVVETAYEENQKS